MRLFKYKIYPQLDYQLEKQIIKFQFSKIKKQLHYVYNNSKFYRKLFDKHKINIDKIKSIKDFQNIPLTTKEDLRKYNQQFICVNKKNWVDVFATTGTTGEKIYFPITRSDLSRTAYAEYRCLTIAGVKKEDIIQFTYPLSTAMWGAGISYYLGYQLIGSCVLRYGPGNAEEQIDNIEKLGATVIHSQSAFLLKLGKLAQEKGILKKLKVRLILPAIENLLNEDLTRNQLGKLLEETWYNSRLCAVYGNTESASPINECEYKSGYHITSEFCYYEILNKDTLKPLPAFEKGILVITPLDVEGLPLIRYNLGDISFLIEGKCKCNRCGLRLGPILARADEMIKIKGVSTYPAAIENILLSTKEITGYYITLTKDRYHQDVLNIYIATSSPSPEIKEKLNNTLKNKLQISANIFIKKEEEIKKKISSKDKAKEKRFFDLRNLHKLSSV